MPVEVHVDSVAKVWRAHVSTYQQYDALMKACEVVVPATLDKAEEHIRLWETVFVSGVGEYVCLPRGIVPFLEGGLGPIKIEDKRVEKHLNSSPLEKEIVLRQNQEGMVKAILQKHEGILVAPPGAGKTIGVLEAVRRSNQRAIIIVDRINIAHQWKDAWFKLYGGEEHCPPWQILGDGSGNIHDTSCQLTIALQQTLFNLPRYKLASPSFGFACLDECHHVTAATYMKTINLMPAKYRIGVSATPTRDDGLEKVSQLILGPVIHRVTKAQMKTQKVLVDPKIFRVQTKFDMPFWRTHSVAANQSCDVPNCKKIGKKHSHRNNYSQITSALVEDEKRNAMIWMLIHRNQLHTNLVVSDRLGHLDTLYALCLDDPVFDPDRLHMLTGRESSAERENIYKLAGYGECVIFSTIAKEALDIPRLDRLYLTWPIKRDHLLEQQIGRVTRAHPDKAPPIVYDLVDPCSVLKNQSWNRLKYYNENEYEVEEYKWL